MSERTKYWLAGVLSVAAMVAAYLLLVGWGLKGCPG